MKKTLIAGAAALSLLATPAAAQSAQCVTDATGALVVGTAVGVGTGVALYNGAIVSQSATVGLTTAGAAVGGLVAGIGAVALYDMFTSPCRGFGILFNQQRAQPVVLRR